MTLHLSDLEIHNICDIWWNQVIYWSNIKLFVCLLFVVRNLMKLRELHFFSHQILVKFAVYWKGDIFYRLSEPFKNGLSVLENALLFHDFCSYEAIVSQSYVVLHLTVFSGDSVPVQFLIYLTTIIFFCAFML